MLKKITGLLIISTFFLTLTGCGENGSKDTKGDTEVTKVIVDYSNRGLDILPPDFSNDKDISILDLSGNKLTDIPASIKKLKGLEEIDLSNNLFTEVPAVIYELPKLKKLNISFNKIKYLRSAFRENVSLEVLILKGNKIQKVPQGLSKLESILFIDLSSNEIDKIENVYFPKLLHADFSDNKLTILPESILSPVISRLDLSGNLIGKIPDIIKNCRSLKVLDLSANKIWYFPSDMGNMVSLKTLDLSKNNLTYFPVQLSKIYSLEEIWYDYNSVSFLSSGIKALSNLKKISLKNNMLKVFPEILYDMGGQLAEVYLDNNYIGVISEDIAERMDLMVLSVRGNPVSSRVPDKLINMEYSEGYKAVFGKNGKVLLY